jgi:drug/metabolite transporter (DMT)-like permease
MFYLFAAIILTSYLTLSFKVVERFRISNLQAIICNYWACVATGTLLTRTLPFRGGIHEPWMPWALLMGLLFISLFNLIAFTAQRINVAVSSVANKLSLVIPFVLAIWLYGEKVSAWQVLGIGLALVAVLLTCWPRGGIHGASGKEHKGWMLVVPAILFAGSGLLDSLVKYVEQRFMQGGGGTMILSTAFAVAGILGTVLLLSLILLGKEKFDPRAILAGVAIGVPNYLSIWFLVKVLGQYPGRSSMIFPVVNMGIVLFSTAVAWLLFGEHISRLNRAGILLALAAIALIAWG